MPKLDGINIQRTQRQHASVVVVIPKAVRLSLGITAGDYVVFASHSDTGVVELSKFKEKGGNHGRDTKHPDHKARHWGARAQDGDRQ